MDVLFLTLYPDSAASPRYRVGQFIPHLTAAGIRCTVAPALPPARYEALRNASAAAYHAAETLTRIGQILAARRYDAVVVQKAVATAYVRGLDVLLRNRARRLIYDIDDAVHLVAPHPLGPPWTLLEDRSQSLRLLAQADLVLAGNRWLVAEAERAGAKVRYFPTVVDTDRFTPATEAPNAFRIGWMGNPSTIVCIEPGAHEALHRVAGAELRFVGAYAKDVPWPNADVRPWRYETEVAEVQQFSVGIMPMTTDGSAGPAPEWMRGKCGLKGLIYMACGVPCVATSFGAALDIIEHERTGLFAESAADWLAAFDRLRDSAEHRRIAEAARASVEERYSLRNAAPQLAEWIQNLP